jgi:hypothetical protein
MSLFGPLSKLLVSFTLSQSVSAMVVGGAVGGLIGSQLPVSR